jgi:hypothetical protein
MSWGGVNKAIFELEWTIMLHLTVTAVRYIHVCTDLTGGVEGAATKHN